MKTITLTIELEYDDKAMHGDNVDDISWFYQEILNENKGLLMLHSNEIGDCVGNVKVLSFKQ